MIIGITGLTGSGKSYLTNLIEYHYKTYTDVKILDCDKIYHNLIKPNMPCWLELKQEFGEKIINSETNEIDRKMLATIVFNSPVERERERLNTITWKYVKEALKQDIESLDPRDVGIIDCPLLFPSSLDTLCDKIIITEACLIRRLQRIVDRDGLSDTQALARINSQSEINQYGDNILWINTNNGVSEEQVETVIKFIGE